MRGKRLHPSRAAVAPYAAAVRPVLYLYACRAEAEPAAVAASWFTVLQLRVVAATPSFRSK